MSEEVEFELLSVLLLDYGFPPDAEHFKVSFNEVMWQYSFRYHISKFPNNKKAININMKYKLYRQNDPKKKSIVRLEISNMFSVTSGISPAAKLQLLYLLLPTVVWNAQGIYAVKTEGSPLASILPPEMDFKQFEESFKEKIADEWD